MDGDEAALDLWSRTVPNNFWQLCCTHKPSYIDGESLACWGTNLVSQTPWSTEKRGEGKNGGKETTPNHVPKETSEASWHLLCGLFSTVGITVVVVVVVSIIIVITSTIVKVLLPTLRGSLACVPLVSLPSGCPWPVCASRGLLCVPACSQALVSRLLQHGLAWLFCSRWRNADLVWFIRILFGLIEIGLLFQFYGLVSHFSEWFQKNYTKCANTIGASPLLCLCVKGLKSEIPQYRDNPCAMANKSLRLALLALTALALIAPSQATYGVDVSQETLPSAWSCLKRNGFTYGVVRAFQSTGEVDPLGPHTIANARDGGMTEVDVYMFPCPRCAASPQDQVRTAVNYLRRELRIG